MNRTLDLLDDLLLELKPSLKRQDPAWRAAEQNAQVLYKDFKTAHAGNRRLIRQVNDLLDAKGQLEEFEEQYWFRLSLQMGLELGGLDLLEK